MADLDSYFYISLPRADFGICGGKMFLAAFIAPIWQVEP
ncbi:predicted protein [Botrytis cinerea T4]|uniref:Uncharacterized protein n=1 Tax=Botryotinia fuckeliana (strain T4) TaxID=999810 RepID=G2YFU3_BOTF4|nr:predicted protein [Botrytis cinerea T4]